MTFVVVQHGSWPGWPDGVTVELESNTGAAVLTAAHDFQRESGVDLKGDLIALPAGGLRPEPWIVEMQWAFDHRHDTGANKAKSVALYAHYNMDTGSNARPVLSSPHARGFCVDIANSRFLAWLIINGARYGLRRTLVAENDLRHFQFFPGTATVALDVTSLDNTPPKPKTGLPVRIIHEVNAAQTVNINFWAVTETDAWIITRDQERILTLAFFDSGLDVEGNFTRMQTADITALQALLRAHAPAGAGSAPDIDEAALAADLAKLLPSVSKTDLAAAQKAIVAALTPTYPKA